LCWIIQKTVCLIFKHTMFFPDTACVGSSRILEFASRPNTTFSHETACAGCFVSLLCGEEMAIPGSSIPMTNGLPWLPRGRCARRSAGGARYCSGSALFRFQVNLPRANLISIIFIYYLSFLRVLSLRRLLQVFGLLLAVMNVKDSLRRYR
jgi:hypothetical protein